ncbi:MAG: helix-turn-helix transcriptional regulator [Candidatus Desulforudis sp.]|nr:helix-turn-helix transcriptional regulator [Desulforudis sp.]
MRLSQVALAQKFNISQSAVSAYEVGRKTPPVDMLVGLASYFGVSVDYLLGISNVREPACRASLEAMSLFRRFEGLPSRGREKILLEFDWLERWL